jgi:hypothetical protein
VTAGAAAWCLECCAAAVFLRGAGSRPCLFAVCSTRTLLVRSVDDQLGTLRGRYDEHNSKISLGMKPRFNRPVGERNHF